MTIAAMCAAICVSCSDEAPVPLPELDGGPPIATSGCGTPHDPGEVVETIRTMGVDREIHIITPEGYDPSTPVPLIIHFESGPFGLGGPELTVWVKHLGDRVNAFAGWADDVDVETDRQMFQALLERMRSEYCVDNNRIFTVGHSNDGSMAATMACETSDVRAFASRAGNVVYCNSNSCVGGIAPDHCHGPVNGIILHGVADTSVDFDPFGRGTNEWFGALNGCGMYDDQETGTVLRPFSEPAGDLIPGFEPCRRRRGCNAEQWWCYHDNDHSPWDRGEEAILYYFRRF